MGGSRCGYRNCTVKTDGQTHFFHFPVFDKVRCHQWISNAKKSEFLNLKVSQLKNRVVCQHHFTDDSFMNFKKDKLKFDAVPTLNGPFSAPDLEPVQEDPEQSLPITVDDIEVDKLTTSEKQANFSIKYADFLTSSDYIVEKSVRAHSLGSLKNDLEDFRVVDEDNRKTGSFTHRTNVKKNNNHHAKDNVVINNQQVMKNIKKENVDSNQLQTSLNQENTTKSKSNIKRKSKIKILSEKTILEPVKVTGNLEPVLPTLVLKTRAQAENSINSNEKQPNDQNNKNGINSIFEMFSPNDGKISISYDPNFDPSLEHPTEMFVIPPSAPNMYYEKAKPLLLEVHDLQNQTSEVIQVSSFEPNEMRLSSLPSIMTNTQLQISQSYNQPSCSNQQSSSGISLLKGKIEPETEDKQNMSVQVHNIQEPKLSSVPSITNSSSQNNVGAEASPRKNQLSGSNKPSSSLLKNKIAPERIAEIEEKRKFNKKLRDIIEFCLDGPEELENKKGQIEYSKDISKNNITAKAEQKDRTSYEKVNSLKKCIKEKNTSVQQQIVPQSNTPKVQYCTQSDVAGATVSETHMVALQARLQLMEETLLNRIGQNTKSIEDLKKAVDIRLKSEQEYKKHLYNEISKFLPSSVNSLIYEEIFLKKFSKNKEQEDLPLLIPTKRQRRR